MVITVIGLGLIGGSIAKRLKLTGFATEVIGVDVNPNHQQEAIELGLVDEVLPLEEAVKRSSLVIIAIPVDKTVDLVPEVLSLASDNTVVVDMGSTKKVICDTADNHPKRMNFVATHPMAGTENSGPTAADSQLFENKTAIICDRLKSGKSAVSLVEQLYAELNMNVIEMEAEDHDVHIAYVSHLSHVISFVLSETVLDKEKDVKHIFNMAGSGFASTVRLAKSSPDMWTPIFKENAKPISDVIGTYIDNLQKFKNMLDTNNSEGVYEVIERANSIQKVLK
ncbi:MAG: prephenate dehydrogenase [Cyclobacteriaceae bacterium]|nr:prephenate dehydrogenase [Cyclobacteriaceae bacterium]